MTRECKFAYGTNVQLCYASTHDPVVKEKNLLVAMKIQNYEEETM